MQYATAGPAVELCWHIMHGFACARNLLMCCLKELGMILSQHDAQSRAPMLSATGLFCDVHHGLMLQGRILQYFVMLPLACILTWCESMNGGTRLTNTLYMAHVSSVARGLPVSGDQQDVGHIVCMFGVQKVSCKREHLN